MLTVYPGRSLANSSYSVARGGMSALVSFIPVGAAVLSFITYALSGHTLDVAIIFTALQFFNVMFLCTASDLLGMLTCTTCRSFASH